MTPIEPALSEIGKDADDVNPAVRAIFSRGVAVASGDVDRSSIQTGLPPLYAQTAGSSLAPSAMIATRDASTMSARSSPSDAQRARQRRARSSGPASQYSASGH